MLFLPLHFLFPLPPPIHSIRYVYSIYSPDERCERMMEGEGRKSEKEEAVVLKLRRKRRKMFFLPLSSVGTPEEGDSGKKRRRKTEIKPR